MTQNALDIFAYLQFLFAVVVFAVFLVRAWTVEDFLQVVFLPLLLLLVAGIASAASSVGKVVMLNGIFWLALLRIGLQSAALIILWPRKIV